MAIVYVYIPYFLKTKKWLQTTHELQIYTYHENVSYRKKGRWRGMEETPGKQSLGSHKL